MTTLLGLIALAAFAMVLTVLISVITYCLNDAIGSDEPALTDKRWFRENWIPFLLNYVILVIMVVYSNGGF